MTRARLYLSVPLYFAQTVWFEMIYVVTSIVLAARGGSFGGAHPLAPAQVAPAQLNDLTQSLFALVVIGILLSVFVADGICVRRGLQHGFVIMPLPLVVFNPPLANWLSLAGFSAAAAVFASFLFAPRELSREFILTPALNIGNNIGGLAQLAFVAHQVIACAAFVTASSCRFHRQGRETHLVG